MFISIYRQQTLKSSFCYRNIFNKNSFCQSSTRDIEQEVYHNLIHKIGYSRKDKFLLSVSGGVDSMAMLHIFAQIKQKLDPDLNFEVVTFNHGLRPESDDEIRFVQQVASHYNIITHIRTDDNNHLKMLNGVQAAARLWRRSECLKLISHSNFLDQFNSTNTNTENSKGYITTAHHADDQLETMLLKFTRGVHISRFTGMLYKSKCKRFIKPLLSLSKKDLVNYMVSNQYTWMEDKSNLSSNYKRNDIRLNLIPILQKLSGSEEGMKKRFQQLGQQSLELRKWIEFESLDYLKSTYAEKRKKKSKYGPINVMILKEIVEPYGLYSHIPNLVKTEIFYQIIQTLVSHNNDMIGITSSSLNETFNHDVDDTNDNIEEEKKEYYISYEKLTELAELCNHPLSHSINTKRIDVSDHVVAIRIEDVIKMEYHKNGWKVDSFKPSKRKEETIEEGKDTVNVEMISYQHDNGVKAHYFKVNIDKIC
jgi:tRNA(Ile)-lysidine synthase